MNSHLTLRPRRAVAIMATLATGLLTGLNASRAVDERAAALDKAIPAAMERASVPGAIIGIWQDGREPYVRAFGVRDTANGQPMTTDLYMRIGSTSKSFTITAAGGPGEASSRRPDRPLRQGCAERRPDHAEAARGNAQRVARLRRRN
jgi:hypothetical protein